MLAVKFAILAGLVVVQAQHLAGIRGRSISEFETSLLQRKFQEGQGYQRNPVSKSTTKEH